MNVNRTDCNRTCDLWLYSTQFRASHVAVVTEVYTTWDILSKPRLEKLSCGWMEQVAGARLRRHTSVDSQTTNGGRYGDFGALSVDASGLCDDDRGCDPVFCRATAVDDTDVAARAVFVRRRTNSTAE